MREGEIFGLQWTAIDFESGSLYVRGTLTKGKNNETILGSPKASRRRRIDMGPRLAVLLQEQKRRQYPLGPWVFTDKVGRLLRKDRFVRTVFHPLLDKAGIRRIRFHDLRHTSATLGIAAGENVKVVAERLGHSSAKLTLDVYAKALPTLQRDAAARMDVILANDGGTKGGTPSTKEG
jgi:integrase